MRSPEYSFHFEINLSMEFIAPTKNKYCLNDDRVKSS